MNTKPFDLKAAFRGAKVVNEKGMKVDEIGHPTHEDVDGLLGLHSGDFHLNRKIVRALFFNDGMPYDEDYSLDGKSLDTENGRLLMLTDEQGNYIYDQNVK